MRSLKIPFWTLMTAWFCLSTDAVYGQSQKNKEWESESSPQSIVPSPIRGVENWDDIAAGFNHTCGIRKDGSLWCWGNNETGGIGDGTTTNRFLPVRIASGRWESVALGDFHTCAIRSDDSLWCWGAHSYGTVRADHKIEDAKPKRITLSTKAGHELKFAEVAIGDAHTCALTTNGIIYCWGGSERQNGRGEPEVSNLPPDQAPLIRHSFETFRSLVVGSGHTCALTIKGQAYCWGRNDRGQVGNGSPESWNPPPSPVDTRPIEGTKTFREIAAGTFHTCGVMTDGAVYCWGANDKGQLGSSQSGDQRLPVRVDTSQVQGSKEFVSVTAGFAFSCGLTKDHSAYCWGEAIPGRCGNERGFGTCWQAAKLDLSMMGENKFVKKISAGCSHACLITVEGKGYCWGNNEDGRLGNSL